MNKLKKSDINLEEWEFEFQQRNSNPILMADLWCRSLCYNYKKEINLEVDNLDYMFIANAKAYVKKEQKKKVIDTIKIAIKNKDYLNYIINTNLKRINELDLITYEIIKEIKNNITKKELAKLWEKFDKKFLTKIPWFFIPWYITEENIISDKVKNNLTRHKREIEEITNFNNALMLLIFPTKVVEFQKEQRDLYNLIKLAKEDKDFKNNKKFIEKAEIYLKKYAWMKTYMVLPIEPLTFNELIKRINNSIKENFIEDFELQEKKKIENQKLIDQLINILSKDKELIDKIEFAREFGWLLTFGVEKIMFSLSKLLPFYKKIAETIEIPYPKWVNLTSKEISKLLNSEIKIIDIDIKERDKGFIFLMENGIQKMITGEKAVKLSNFIDNNIENVDKNISKFSGQSASPGKVSGKIRIIPKASDADKLKQGEILVCSMTSPDYVPAMKRAAAIITDEGGLLSHATIVSRELGVPCIIGTKIATKVLKDGDLIEVDANEGVVKILEKAKLTPNHQ